MTTQQGLIKSKMKKFSNLFLFLFLVTFPASVSISADLQETADTKDQKEVYLYKGDLVVLKVYSLTRLAISKPDIVDVANADVNEVLIVGQKVGTTQIFIWDELGKRQIIASVLKEDLDLIMTRLQKLFEQSDIKDIKMEKNNYEGKVVLSGEISADKAGRFGSIADKFGDNIINLVSVDPVKELIQVDIQVTELSTTLSKEMGIDWTAGGSAGITLSYPETMPTLTPGLKDLFKIGTFQRSSASALLATVSFLIAEGKARVLSKPSIVVNNGESASLLVGGEIPVRTTTASSGGSSVQENISFKSYGIDLNVTPRIVSDKISLTITVAVRDIDASNAVGDDVAFTNRSVNTQLFLDDGQTIVIAGLIKQNRSEAINRVPYISKIPIVGMLFRNKSQPNADFDQELVITITPKVYKDDTKADDVQKAMDKQAEESSAPIPAVSSDSASGDSAPVSLEDVSEGEDADARDKALDDAMSADQEEKMAMDIEKEDAVDAESEKSLTSEKNLTPDIGKEAGQAEEAEVDLPGMEDEDPRVDELSELPEDSVQITEPVKAEAEELADDGQLQEAALASYVQAVQSTIAEAISFPYEAREKGWEGTVLLSLTILSDGTLQEVEIKKSSGYNVFDNDAKNTAQILSPFDPFPPELDLEEIVVSFPIVYSQKMLTQ